jgi:hypothetical protein
MQDTERSRALGERGVAAVHERLRAQERASVL